MVKACIPWKQHTDAPPCPAKEEKAGLALYMVVKNKT
jgi:hypothetical protein